MNESKRVGETMELLGKWIRTQLEAGAMPAKDQAELGAALALATFAALRSIDTKDDEIIEGLRQLLELAPKENP